MDAAGLPETFQVGALPPGVAAPKSKADRELYRSALGFEGVLTQHLVDEMLQSAQGDDSDSDGSGVTGLYREMEGQALNQALVSGGGLGLAGAIYASLEEARS